MKLQIVLEPSEEGGYTAIVPALPGCLSEGESREEALANVQEAIALYLEPIEDDRGFGPNAESPGSRRLSKVPSLNYEQVINALRRDGWLVVRQRGSQGIGPAVSGS
jgi:predicted RNase H-like HicB family nuclease